jgi:hypothetical protein
MLDAERRDAAGWTYDGRSRRPRLLWQSAGVVRAATSGPRDRDLLETGTDGAVVGGEVEAALSELHGTQEIDHCGADFVRSFLLRPVAAALKHEGTAQLGYEVR